MAYDTRLLARARDVLEARRRENRREQDRRRALAAEKAPEALELERELTGLMARLDEYRAALDHLKSRRIGGGRR